ncbi:MULTISPECIES: hypothetical protein [unclassified Yoonia]|uniref:hypothetical protein n=1 Tax=unclassified Yoonia TaxID=2629118 RepID=UPI002AFE39C0|nr:MULTISPECIES: hypothetical protein [unclassified Yoonia]
MKEVNYLNLLEHTASTLIREGVVENYREFSRKFCRKTENFYYRQTHFNRDFSTDALINCLKNIRRANKHYNKWSVVFQSEKDALTELDELLTRELQRRLGLKIEFEL